MNLGASRIEGFLCGVQVTDGKATFTIEAEGRSKVGTMSVSVYQLQAEDVVIGEKLGQFEIYWTERK